jgi:hypothetical protein
VFLAVGRTLADMCALREGLSEDEAADRLREMGENTVPMEKASLGGSLFHEFSKIFYVYQVCTRGSSR